MDEVDVVVVMGVMKVGEGEKESTSRERLVDLEYKHSTVEQWKRRH